MRYLVLVALIAFALVGLYWYSTGEKPNVSGERQNTLIDLYYYDPATDLDEQGNILCSRQGLVPVERNLPRTLGNLEETIKLLVRGELTVGERSEGITTEFPLDGFELAAATLEHGTLTLTFDDPLNHTSGGACRVSVLRAQIEATARQFPGVEVVRFAPEELFQP